MSSPNSVYRIDEVRKCLKAIPNADVRAGVRSLPTDAPSLFVQGEVDSLAHILFGDDHEHAVAMGKEFGGSDASSVRGNVLIRWAAADGMRDDIESCFP